MTQQFKPSPTRAFGRSTINENMANEQALVSVLMSLVSSIMAYFQLHIAILNYQAEYLEKRRSIIRLLFLPTFPFL